ncbi:MAG: hypothetical protein QM817_32525 [Archangium sp.]
MKRVPVALRIGLALAAASAPAVAHAQACCAGASLLSPARLTPYEETLVGFELRSLTQFGSADARGHFTPTPANSGSEDVVLTLHHTLRVGENGQLTWSLPLDVGARWIPGLNEGAISLGDVAVSFRHDFLLAGESASRPGIAVLASILAPTGTAPENAHSVLGADAVGSGSWQASLGAGIEQRWGQLTAQLMVLLQERLPRTALGLTQVFGPGLSLGGALAWSFESELSLALTANSTASLPSWIDGKWSPDTARSRTTAGLALATPLGERWRLQASLSVVLPFALNELATFNASVLLMRTWS